MREVRNSETNILSFAYEESPTLRAEREMYMAVDWVAIRTDYVTTNTSYRKICEKYGLSFTEVSRHGREENWREERKKYQEKTYSKTIEIMAKNQAKRVERLKSITDKILDKIETVVDNMTGADIQAYRQVTSALKDIKEIQMLKSDADMREQEARIANLKKQALDDVPKEIKVHIQGEANDYSK